MKKLLLGLKPLREYNIQYLHQYQPQYYFFQHEFLIIESKCVANILFSGRRVTENILKSSSQIPEDFGTASGIMKAGLADITLKSRKELKSTLTKLASIILKKGELLDKKYPSSNSPEEQISTSLQKTSEAV